MTSSDRHFAQQHFIGHIARLKFRTAHSYEFELFEQLSKTSASLIGWLHIHFPCDGAHKLHIFACLNPEVALFESHEFFGGRPGTRTRTIMAQLVAEVRDFLQIPATVSWHIHLQSRSYGTFDEDPNTLL